MKMTLATWKAMTEFRALKFDILTELTGSATWQQEAALQDYLDSYVQTLPASMPAPVARLIQVLVQFNDIHWDEVIAAWEEEERN